MGGKVQRDNGDNWIIVIDPGHGGENLGTIENGFLEKEMTLQTADAMMEELSGYDGLTVYITRTGDEDLTLKERAEYAKEMGADFLISLHYNASEVHRPFGSEVYIPSGDAFQSFAYSFAKLQLEQLKNEGLFIRGIKTRLDEDGLDYYGIIRESAALDIPAVILEHCYVDEERDTVHCDSEAGLETFGRLDGKALAQFLGLGSEQAIAVTGDNRTIRQENAYLASSGDSTKPDVCYISAVKADYAYCQVDLEVTAADYDSTLLYYDYSLDGGETYSDLMPWPGSNALTGAYQDICHVTIEIPRDTFPVISLRAYNMYDLCTESNTLSDFSVFTGTGLIAKQDESGGEEGEAEIPTGESAAANDRILSSESVILVTDFYGENGENGSSFKGFLEFSVILLMLVLGFTLIGSAIHKHKKKKRRKKW
jgi:N-acetylmuramoyl-L-alanine amidase